MDTVLGVSMAPSTVRMVLVEGDNGDGATVEQDDFALPGNGDATLPSAPEQVVSAILGTREGAAEGGYQLASTGVTWTDQLEAAALRDALAARKIENVMLVSAFLAAAALAQSVGSANGYGRTGLLFVEPDAATTAIVDSADGSVVEARREPFTSGDPAAELAAMVGDMQTLESRPDGLFLIGSGVDVGPLKPQLEATTSLPVSAPEEPATALARGAALAAAHAPLFSSSTAALAYAQDPGTGAVDPYAVTPAYRPMPDGAAAAGGDALAYSAVADDEANAPTALADRQPAVPDEDQQSRPRRRLTLVSGAVAAIFVVGVVALAIALVVTLRPTGERPDPGHKMVVPGNSAPQQAPPPAPPPASGPAPAPAPAAPAPAAPAPAPAAPAPAAPAPAPAAPPPAAPVVPQIPQIPGLPGGGGGPPGIPGGGHGGGGGGGHGGGGGIPGVPGIPGIPGL